MEFPQRITVYTITLTTIISLLIHSSTATLQLQGYNEICKEDKECDSGFCNPKHKTCDCLMYRDRAKGTAEYQFYDEELKMCFSKVGQLCTLPTVDDQLTVFRCAPDAECIARSNQGMSTEFFGRCTCKFATQPSKDLKRCISNVEVRTGKAKVMAMDQVRPEGWNKGGAHSSFHSSKFILWGLYVASVMCSALMMR